MAARKFIYVDSNGDYIESAGAYESADHINSSAGAGDAGKPIKLDASGLLDYSFFPDSVINAIDYKDSVRVASASDVTISGPGTAIDGVTLTSGDRVLLAGQTDASENGIYVFNGDATPMTRASDADADADVTAGMRVPVEEGTLADNMATLTTNNPITLDTTDLTFAFLSVTNLVAGDGIDIGSGTVSVDLASGGGLKIVSTELAIEPNDFAGAGLVDDGSDNLAIDWATSSSDDKAWKASSLIATTGAAQIGGDSSGIANSSSSTVQAILEDLDDAIVAVGTPGVSYTVGTGGVSKGDLVYVSANDTVLPKDITDSEYAVGLCATTESAAASVKIVGENYVLTGVLSGATAGTRYYWSGSALTATMPATSANYVWLCGVAKNASDLDVHVEFIKKNS